MDFKILLNFAHYLSYIVVAFYESGDFFEVQDEIREEFKRKERQGIDWWPY